MNSDKRTEKAFELAEQFEFNELVNEDKIYILSVMTEAEYRDLRKTIFALPEYFLDDIDPAVNIPQLAHKQKKSKLRSLILYPIQLYKVAASIIIAFFLFNVLQNLNENQNSELVVKNDTIFIQRTDTIYQIIHDTVLVVEKEKTFPKLALAQKTILENETSQACYNPDELRPDDIENIMAMTTDNCLANDSVLKNLLVLLN